jgi:hypothetical protein
LLQLLLRQCSSCGIGTGLRWRGSRRLCGCACSATAAASSSQQLSLKICHADGSLQHGFLLLQLLL